MIKPFLSLFLSLALLRIQYWFNLKISFAKAIDVGLIHGLVSDYFFTFLPVIAAQVVALSFPVARIRKFRPDSLAFVLTAFVLWGATLANLLYSEFFEGNFEWWVLRYHWNEIFHIGGSATALSFTPLVMLSLAFFLFSILKAFRVFEKRPLKPVSRGHALVVLALLIAFFLVGRQAPRWFRYPLKGHLLEEQIVLLWWEEWTGSRGKRSHALGDVVESTVSKTESMRLEEGMKSLVEIAQGTEAATSKRSYPLYREVSIPPELTVSRRQSLGLPAEGPIHVLVLFVESLRHFERGHRDLGEKLFPNLVSLYKKHGIEFSQAYSSARESALTVRGQFSTLCSFYPNMMGPPEFTAHPTLRITCLADRLKEFQYQTNWFHSMDETYAGMSAFESLHGMDTFYGNSFFDAEGVTEKIGQWGFGDRSFLQVTLKRLRALAELKKNQPIFANILTVSTHHPHSFLEEGKVPEAILKATQGATDYQKFLSHLTYSEKAITEFVKNVFASPELGSRTVIVLLGDHSVPIDPHVPLDPAQNREMNLRIQMAILTKNMPKPRRIDRPVHQIDVAPTLLEIVGGKTQVSWVGRGLFAPEGSPLIYGNEDRYDYRFGDVACYTLKTETQPLCYRIPKGLDPLYDWKKLIPIPVDLVLLEKVRAMVAANRQLISLNRILPQ